MTSQPNDDGEDFPEVPPGDDPIHEADPDTEPVTITEDMQPLPEPSPAHLRALMRGLGPVSAHEMERVVRVFQLDNLAPSEQISQLLAEEIDCKGWDPETDRLVWAPSEKARARMDQLWDDYPGESENGGASSC